MVGRVTRQGNAPDGVEFCRVNVSRWDNPHSQGSMRNTSNSRKIHLGGGLTLHHY